MKKGKHNRFWYWWDRNMIKKSGKVLLFKTCIPVLILGVIAYITLSLVNNDWGTFILPCAMGSFLAIYFVGVVMRVLYHYGAVALGCSGETDTAG